MILFLLGFSSALACTCAEEIDVERGFPATTGTPTNTRIHVPVINRGSEFVTASSVQVELMGPDGPVALGFAEQLDTSRGALGIWQPQVELPAETEFSVAARAYDWVEDPVRWTFTTGSGPDTTAPGMPTVRSASEHLGRNDSPEDSCAVSPNRGQIDVALAGLEPVLVVLDRGLSVYVAEPRETATLGWSYDRFCSHDPPDLGSSVSAHTLDLAGNRSEDSPAVEVVFTEEEGGSGCGSGCATAPASGGLAGLLVVLLGVRRHSARRQPSRMASSS